MSRVVENNRKEIKKTSKTIFPSVPIGFGKIIPGKNDAINRLSDLSIPLPPDNTLDF
jgi:hypothetical protein